MRCCEVNVCSAHNDLIGAGASGESEDKGGERDGGGFYGALCWQLSQSESVHVGRSRRSSIKTRDESTTTGAPPPLTHLLRGYGTPALPGDNLLIASPPGYAVAPSTKVNLRNVPTRPPSAHRNAPQLPVHIVAAGLTPKPAAYSAAAVTADAACRWSAAWAGIPRATVEAQGHRRPPPALMPFVPSGNPVVNELPTREAAGSLLLRVALKRPAAREAWQEASLERKKTAEEIRRERRVAALRAEKRLINSSIRRAPRPIEPNWQPPSPSRSSSASA